MSKQVAAFLVVIAAAVLGTLLANRLELTDAAAYVLLASVEVVVVLAMLLWTQLPPGAWRRR